MKVVVVDDSKAMRMIIGRALRELQFDVSEAANGREALARLEEQGDLDLVMVDWHMPEMNGLEFVQALRRHPRFASLPVMMVTSESELDQVRKAMEAGASEFVMKPFTREVLLEKLRLLGLVP